MEFFEEDELLNTSDVLFSNVLSHSISELAPSSLLTTVAVKNENISSDFPHLFTGGAETMKEESLKEEIKEEVNTTTTTTKTEESESEGEGDSEIEDDDEEMGEEDYERQRQENIKRNQQLLQQLGFSNGGLASQALEESQEHIADDDSLLQCVMCEKREGMIRKTLRGVAQTTFGRRYKPDITEENRAWFADFFGVSPESLKLGPVCNYCYQHQYSQKQKEKTEKLRQENKMNLRTRKRAEEQQENIVTPPTTPSKSKSSPKQPRTPAKDHCTVCGRKEGEASQTITGRSTIVSFKCSVNASNVERYTSFFNQEIEFGQICNVCYGDWYRTTYKKGSPKKKSKTTSEKSPVRGASAITQVKSPRVARPRSMPKKPGRPRKTEATVTTTAPKSSPRISKKRKHKK